MKNIKEFLYENVQFLVITFSIYLNRRVFIKAFLYSMAESCKDLKDTITISSFSMC